MKKNIPYFLVAFTIIGAGAFGVVFIKNHQKLGVPGVKIAALPLFDSQGKQFTTQSVDLPGNVLDFHSQPLPISNAEITTLPKDTTFGRRLYEGPDGMRVMCSVILMGADRTSIHKPEFCIPGQGWKIVTQDVASVAVQSPAPYTLPIMKWVIEQKQKSQTGDLVDMRGIYAFWFVSRDQVTPYHSGRFVSTIKNLLQKGELERWAYVSCFTLCAPGQEDITFKRLQAFIAASTPEFQVTSGLTGASLAHSAHTLP